VDEELKNVCFDPLPQLSDAVAVDTFKFRELLRYIRKLRCTGTPILKIFKLTIIFME